MAGSHDVEKLSVGVLGSAITTPYSAGPPITVER